MRKFIIAAALLAAPLGLAAPVLAQTAAQAVADAARPKADSDRDAARKPAEMLAFARIKPGQRIGELLPGGGYFTRIFSKAVGLKGSVLAIVGPAPTNAAAASRPNPISAFAGQPGYENITVVNSAYETMAPPESLDLVWTTENYHDLLNAKATQAVDAAVFKALKPGGTYIVGDHAALPGSGPAAANTLHRIDPAIVKDEVIKAGFVFDGESNAVRNAADNHTLRVFDPAIRGKTDQFVLRFKKPMGKKK